jgi:hypothetical protein
VSTDWCSARKSSCLPNEGKTSQQIARQLHTRTARVSKWRQRFAKDRVAGINDAARSGKPKKTTRRPRSGFWRCLIRGRPAVTRNRTADYWLKPCRGVSRDQVWRILRRHDICLERRRSWCISTDPEFGPKAADMVGLYLNPPEKALVISVDETPSIQALERAQGYLRRPDGKAVNGFRHCYRRHGTTTLFAALEVTTGVGKDGALPAPSPARVS